MTHPEGGRQIPVLKAAKRTVPLWQRLRRTYVRDNPYYLLNLFDTLLAVSFVIVVSVAGVALFWIYSTSMLRNAETSAIHIGKSILSAQLDNLLVENPDGSLRLAIAGGNMQQTDVQMQRFLRFFDVHRIVIFDNHGRVIYSTDPIMRGKDIKEGDALLDATLKEGKPHSRIIRRSADLSGDLLDSSSLFVSSYTPISDARGQSLGAFEVYVNIGDTAARVVKAVSLSLFILAAVLGSCLLMLYRPMKRGTRELIAAHRELRELATRDHLTGIYNRRYISERVRQEFHRWRRNAKSMQPYQGISFIMIDIDHFKKINDSYGHSIGDEVLKEVAHRIGEGLREYEMLGRYGGEEFLVMLPNVDAETAVRIAERLHWAVGGHAIRLQTGRCINVTISLGVACATDSDIPAQEIVRCADLALYEAKEAGRDRVVLYRPPRQKLAAVESL